MTRLFMVFAAAVLLASCATSNSTSTSNDGPQGGGERIGKGSGDAGTATNSPATTDTTDESTPN